MQRKSRRKWSRLTSTGTSRPNRPLKEGTSLRNVRNGAGRLLRKHTTRRKRSRQSRRRKRTCLGYRERHWDSSSHSHHSSSDWSWDRRNLHRSSRNLPGTRRYRPRRASLPDMHVRMRRNCRGQRRDPRRRRSNWRGRSCKNHCRHRCCTPGRLRTPHRKHRNRRARAEIRAGPPARGHPAGAGASPQ